MLTSAESSFVLQYLSVFSSLHIFPFNVDRARGKLKPFRGRSYLIWNLMLVLQSLHYAHGLIQLVLLITVRRDQILLFHLPAQFDGIIIPLLVHPLMIWVFHNRADILIKVFNELYDDDGTRTRRPLWKLSVQELLALSFSIIVPAGIVLYGGMVILFADMAHLLINNTMLRPWKSSALAVTVATLLELWSVAKWLINVGFFMMTLNSLVLSKMESALPKLSALLRDFRSGHVEEIRLRRAYNRAFQAQLLVRQLVVPTWNKDDSHSCGYTARLRWDKVWSFMYLDRWLLWIHSCVLLCHLLWNIPKGPSHRLIELQSQVKQELSAACDKCRSRYVRTELQKAVRVLHCTGMRVGSLHEMERNSALVFIDYVERQLLGLLVTF